MTRLSVRVALVIVCLAASAAAAFLLWTFEQQLRAQQSASREFTSAALAARIAVSDLRGAQQGYVAAGQGPDFWFARVTAIAKELRNDLAALRSLASSPEASIAIEDATGALQDFDQMDRRARDFAHAHQLLSASDLIFADGFDLTKKTGDAVDRALASELAELTGESLTSAVTLALRERLERERRRRRSDRIAAQLMKIGSKYAALADTGRTPDDILGYDEHGLPR